MKERTCFFIKIYFSHFILKRVDVGCVWEVSWKWGQTATYWPKFFWPWQHFFLILAWLLNRGSMRAQSPLSATGSQFGILSPTDSSRLCPDYIFVWSPPASAVLPLIYTGASLGKMRCKVNFWEEYSLFEFRVFFLS